MQVGDPAAQDAPRTGAAPGRPARLVAALGFGTVFTLIAEASTTVPGLFLFPWACLPALALGGLADAAANGTDSVAAELGPVTIAAVLAPLYPVVTALAARVFLRERLRGLQSVGASLTLAGTVLPATG